MFTERMNVLRCEGMMFSLPPFRLIDSPFPLDSWTAINKGRLKYEALVICVAVSV